MQRLFLRGLIAPLAAAIVTASLGQLVTVGHAANIGCEEAKVDVDIDSFSLSRYQEFVRERRCKCLKIAEACAQAPEPPRPADPPPPNTRAFRLYDGRDIDGYDYKRMLRTSQEACIEACKQDRQCIAFSWDRWNDYCFLKHTVPPVVRIDPAAVSAVATTATQPTDSNSPTVIEPFLDAEFRDKPYSEFTAGSYGECERACRDDRDCEVFTYVTNSRSCKLIRRPYEYYRLGPRAERNRTDCVRGVLAACSGVKRQRAP